MSTVRTKLADELDREANKAGREWAYFDLMTRAVAALRAPEADKGEVVAYVPVSMASGEPLWRETFAAKWLHKQTWQGFDLIPLHTIHISAAGIAAPPEGWKLVPARAVQAQMDAGLYQSSHDATWADVYSMYADMIDAAPSPDDGPDAAKPVANPKAPADAGIAAPTMTMDSIDSAFAAYRNSITIMDPKPDHQSFAQGYVAGWNAKEAPPAASADAVRALADKIRYGAPLEQIGGGEFLVLTMIIPKADINCLADALSAAPVAGADAGMQERAASECIAAVKQSVTSALRLLRRGIADLESSRRLAWKVEAEEYLRGIDALKDD